MDERPVWELRARTPLGAWLRFAPFASRAEADARAQVLVAEGRAAHVEITRFATPEEYASDEEGRPPLPAPASARTNLIGVLMNLVGAVVYMAPFYLGDGVRLGDGRLWVVGTPFGLPFLIGALVRSDAWPWIAALSFLGVLAVGMARDPESASLFLAWFWLPLLVVGVGMALAVGFLAALGVRVGRSIAARRSASGF